MDWNEFSDEELNPYEELFGIWTTPIEMFSSMVNIYWIVKIVLISRSVL